MKNGGLRTPTTIQHSMANSDRIQKQCCRTNVSLTISRPKILKKACANSSIKHDLELRPQFNIRVTMVVEFKNQTAKRIKPCYNWQFSNTGHQQLNITELNQKFDVSFWVGPQPFGTQTLESHCLKTENNQKNLSPSQSNKEVFFDFQTQLNVWGKMWTSLKRKWRKITQASHAKTRRLSDNPLFGKFTSKMKVLELRTEIDFRSTNVLESKKVQCLPAN